MAHKIRPSPHALLTAPRCHSLRGEICGPVTMVEMALRVTPKARLEKTAQLLSGELQLPYTLEASPPTPSPCWEGAEGSLHTGGPHGDTHMARNGDPQPADLWVGEPSGDSSPPLEPLKWVRDTLSLLGPAQTIDSWAKNIASLSWVTKFWSGCQEKYRQPQICRGYHSNGRK